MNSEIIKRGMLPHYRFVEHFGYYITMMSELENYLKTDNSENFIDKSQILGSRLLVGSRKLEKEFEDKIIKPYIFDRADDYIYNMINDMKGRHSILFDYTKEIVNLKECPGGLRDIESFLFIIKAKYCIRENINENLFNRLYESNQMYKEKLMDLKEHFYFLKNLRDLYRLTVAANDEITEDRLIYLTKYIDCKYKSPEKRAKYLYNKFKHKTVQVYDTIEYLIKHMAGYSI